MRSQLRECHRQVLVEAREPLDLVSTCIARHAAVERGKWQVLHHLREHVLALVHRPTPPPIACRQDRLRRESRRGPNRHQAETSLPPCAASVYRASNDERWDTSGTGPQRDPPGTPGKHRQARPRRQQAGLRRMFFFSEIEQSSAQSLSCPLEANSHLVNAATRIPYQTQSLAAALLSAKPTYAVSG